MEGGTHPYKKGVGGARSQGRWQGEGAREKEKGILHKRVGCPSKKISTPKRLWCAHVGQRIEVGLGAKSLERGTA